MQCLWLRPLGHYHSYINTNVSGSKLETIDSASPDIRLMFWI